MALLTTSPTAPRLFRSSPAAVQPAAKGCCGISLPRAAPGKQHAGRQVRSSVLLIASLELSLLAINSSSYGASA